MRKLRRLTSLFLAVVLVASTIPVQWVDAQEVIEVESEPTQEAVEGDSNDASQPEGEETEIDSQQQQEEEADPQQQEDAEEEADPFYAEKNDLANSWRYSNGERFTVFSRARVAQFPTWPEVEGSVAKGIDVSHNNGQIDWEKAKAAGVDYAIIRCGYGMDQTDQDDRYWKYNADECTRLGIPFGVYIYSYADTVERAESEAAHVLRLVQGYDLDYPIYYDLEEDNVRNKLSSSEIATVAEAFCNKIENAGYEVGIYSNTDWYTNYLTDARFNQWEKWCAQYNTSCTYKGSYTMWQCSSEGRIDGISTYVDLNIDYGAGPFTNNPQPEEPEPEPEPEPVTLNSIYISKAPAKTAYYDGDKFDKTGMVVKAKWSDGTETDVTSSVSVPTTALVTGTRSINISYTYEGITKTVAQAITVQAKVTTPTVTYTKYKVIATNVNYRTGPGTSYASKGKLQKNAQISVENGYSRSANGYTWYRFSLNGKNYYVASKYLQKIEDSSSSTTTPTSYAVYKTTTRVNYRTGPGTSYSRAGTFVSGKQISIEEGYSKTANGYTWYRFKLNNKTYYIASKYVKKVSTSSSSGSSTTEKLVNHVTTANVNYRTGAGMGNTIVGTIAKGKIVQVVDGWSKTANNIKWAKIKLNGKYYYMAAQYLKRSGASSSSSTTVTEKLVSKKTTTRVNYRTGAGMGNTIVATLPTGTTVQVVSGWSTKANNITWAKIKLNGKYYYMAAQYLR